MSALDISARGAGKAYAAAERVWSRLWFVERPTTPLELVRIGIGAAVLLNYREGRPYLLDFWGDAGLMPRAMVFRKQTLGRNRFSFISRRRGNGSPFMSFFCSAALPSRSGGGRHGSSGSC